MKNSPPSSPTPKTEQPVEIANEISNELEPPKKKPPVLGKNRKPVKKKVVKKPPVQKVEVEKDVKRGAGGAAQIHRHGACLHSHCPDPAHRPHTVHPESTPAPRPHAHATAVVELQGYYNKRTISVYTGEGERRVIAVAAPRVGSCLLTAFLNRRSSAALSISAPPRNPALDWPK